MTDPSDKKQPIEVKVVRQEKKPSFETYLKYTPLAYFFLIIYSYVGLSAYYSVFGIDILAHMSVQELILSPLKSLRSVVVASLIMLLLFIVSFLMTRLFKGDDIKDSEPMITGLRAYFWYLMLVYPGLHLYLGLNTDGRYWVGVATLYAFIGHIFLLIPGIYLLIDWRRNSSSVKITAADAWYRPRKVLINTVTILVFGSAFHYWSMTFAAYDLLEQRTDKVDTAKFLGKTDLISGILIGESNSTIFLRDTLNQTNKAYMKKDIGVIEYRKEVVVNRVNNNKDSVKTQR